MDVTFLGTGSAMPTGERFQTGILLDGVRGGPLLVDCGSGVLHALAATDTGYEPVEHILLTHHHLDHVSDLLPLMKAKWLAGETSLTVAGPPGTPDLVENLLSVHEYMEDRLDLSLREVDPGTFTFGGFDVKAIETIHSMYCLAYRFAEVNTAERTPTNADNTGSSPSFTFSGDTEATEAVADLADGSAVLAHDCSFPDEIDVDNHPTPSQLGEVLAGHDIGEVYLTHLYPHTNGKHQGMVDSVRKQYDGEVRIAQDGLSVSVESSPSK